MMRDFSDWTSIQALPHIFKAEALWIALFWSVVFVIAFCIMVYMIYSTIHKYLSYPVTLTPRNNDATQTFPAVTFCSANPWKLTQVSGTPLEALVNAYNGGQTSATYGFTAPFTMATTMRAARWTQFMFESLEAYDRANNYTLGYTYTDLVKSCEFRQKDCNISGNLYDFYDPYYGHCHTINYNMTWNSSTPGSSQALKMVIRSIGSEYLPWVQSQAIAFFVHGTKEIPFTDAFGYFARVSRGSSVGLTFMDRQRLGHPYSDCVTAKDAPKLNTTNYYSEDYEVESCIRSCLQDQIVSKCGCYDPQFLYPASKKWTSCYDMADVNSAMNCADAITNSNDYNDTFDVAKCGCVPSCDQSYYQVSMSTGAWPAKASTPRECISNRTSQYWSSSSGCWMWYHINTLLLEVYYQSNSYQTYLEGKAYTFVNMIADTGGQLGLWLGMSVISVVEILVLCIMVIAYWFIRPDPEDLDNYDYFKEFNDQIATESKHLIYDKDPLVLDAPPPRVHEAEAVPSLDDIPGGEMTDSNVPQDKKTV